MIDEASNSETMYNLMAHGPPSPNQNFNNVNVTKSVSSFICCFLITNEVNLLKSDGRCFETLMSWLYLYLLINDSLSDLEQLI